jgi:hypothetical protein
MAGAGVSGVSGPQSALINAQDQLASVLPIGSDAAGLHLMNGVTFAALTATQQGTEGTLSFPPPQAGWFANIIDSPVNTWGTAITVGGGSFNVLARFNGVNWTVVGI